MAHATELTIVHGDTVQPDAGLQAFVDDFQRAVVEVRRPDYRKIGKMFATKVWTFQRSLDPLQPWNKTKPIKGDVLSGVAELLVERTAVDESKPLPDDRPEALAMIARMIGPGSSFGTLEEMPGAVCAPARYRFDRDAIVAFAHGHETEATSIRFYAADMVLKKKPRDDAKPAGIVPPGVPLAFEYDKDAPDGWELLAAANGVKGYRKDDGRDVLWLSQHHVCFAKVKGKYRITAIFGYGL